MQERKIAWVLGAFVLVLGAAVFWFWQGQQTAELIDAESFDTVNQNDGRVPRRSSGSTIAQLPSENAPLDANTKVSPNTCTVFGKVKGLGKTDIQELFITFTQKKPGTEVPGEFHYAKPDDKRRYSVSGLTPGKWDISAFWDGAEPYEETIEVEAAAKHEHDIQFVRKIELEAFLETPDRLQLKQIQVGLDRFRDYLSVKITTTSSLGDLKPDVRDGDIPGHRPSVWRSDFTSRAGRNKRLRIGKLVSPTSPPVYAHLVIGQSLLSTVKVEFETQELVFRLTHGEWQRALGLITLKVVGRQSGQPIEGLSIHAERGPFVRMPLDRPSSDTWKSKLIPSGHYDITIDVEGTRQLKKRVIVESGAVTDLGVISINQPVRVSGVVVDENNKPLKASLTYRLQTQSPIVEHPSITIDGRRVHSVMATGRRAGSHVPCDSDGNFVAKNLPPGRYDFQIIHQGYSEFSHQVIVPEEGLENLRLVAEPAFGVGFQFSFRNDHVLSAEIKSADGKKLTLTDDGTYLQQLQLPNGQYTCRVRLLREGWIERDFEVEGKTKLIKID